MNPTNTPTGRRLLLVLAGVSLGGIVLMFWPEGDAGTPTGSLEPGIVARVEGRPIHRARYRRLVETTAQEASRRPDTRLRRRVLDRLIAEELLIQEGLERGLARDRKTVRLALVRAAMDPVIAAEGNEPPDTAALRTFYRENLEYFAPVKRVKVRVMEFRTDSRRSTSPRARARRARRRLAEGGAFQTVREALADTPVIPVPTTGLSRSRLKRYLGSRTARASFRLDPGELSKPIPYGDGVRLVHLRDHVEGEPPSFEAIRPRVRSLFRRRSRDARLREWIERRRERAEVVVREDLP